MIKTAVVVPIYKSVPSNDEKIAFIQLLRVLFKYEIIIVSYNIISLSFYFELARNYNVKINVEYFDEKYFKSLHSYNLLCLNEKFYKRFDIYEYILIYQLDCFVFEDKLNEWCNKNYDYIGAPWFTGNTSHEEGGELWKVGNGGFSLRKVDTFIKLLTYRRNVYSLKRAFKINRANNGNLFDLFNMIFFGKNNRITELIKNWNDAEDIFYCLVLENTKLKLKIPDVKEAMQFAFERSPEYLFIMNKKNLPFGCHAWKKYQFNEFWKELIK